MPDPTTSIPAAVVALREGLRAWTGLATVTITAGPVPRDRVTATMILVGSVEPGEQGYNTIGGRTKREAYAINGYILYLAAGLSGDEGIDAARTGAYGMYGEVERYLWAHPHLDAAGVLLATAAVGRDAPTLADEGTALILEFQVTVEHELRR